MTRTSTKGFKGLQKLHAEGYEKALKAKDIQVYESSEVIHRKEGAITFDIAVIPSLDEKPPPPDEEPDLENKPDNDPLSPPYPKGQYIRDLKVEGGEYVLLNNKNCIVPRHGLLVTKEFMPQAGLLSPADLLASWETILTYTETAVMVFNNNSVEAGASQPHRHLQVVEYQYGREPPAERVALVSNIGSEATYLDLPYVHLVIRLAISKDSSSTETSVLLNAAYESLMLKADSPDAHGLIITREFMHLIPRTAAQARLPRPHSSKESEPFEVAINCLAYAGYLYLAPKDVDTVQAYTILKLLTELGVPR